jgi:pimeloyl-ACP methyl ester carboxylesterase
LATIESDGVRLYFEETGAGFPILWAHEFAADFRTWEAQVRYFARQYRCVTYNARGYPPSDVPEADADYHYEKQVRDLISIMDALQIERAHIVGLSMGAYTGLQTALRHPHRVSALVFASGGTGAKPGEQAEYEASVDQGAARMLQEGMGEAADRVVAGATRIQLLEKDPRGAEEFRRYLAEHSAAGSAQTLKNFQARRPSLYAFEAALSQLDVPVLLAVGDEDDPVIETNLYLKRTLPRSGLWMAPRSGHGLNLEEPGDFNVQCDRFFAAVERGAWKARRRA